MQRHVMMIALACAGAVACRGAELIRRDRSDAYEAPTLRVLPGEGSSVRCLIEPGPFLGECGFRFGCAEDGSGGLEVVLGCRAGEGVALRDAASGKVLWEDAFLTWDLYTPLRAEAVTDGGGVRVQVLDAGGTVLAQGLPVAVPAVGPTGRIALLTRGNSARFTGWSRHSAPLAPYSPNNPTALRLPVEGPGAWTVTGGGAWQWADADRRELLQRRQAERTTAFMPPGATGEGTRRCRIRLDRGTCGGGMAIEADTDLNRGYLAWLGGTYGDGCLMVYRYPLDSLWAGQTGVWHWDTDYVLETDLAGGKLRVRLLAADGETVLSESPSLDVSGDAVAANGRVGFQTWQGTGRFGGFDGDGAAAAGTKQEPADALPGGWLAASGTWAFAAGGERLDGRAPGTDEPGVLANAGIRGSLGTYRCRVVSRDGSPVGLGFQSDPGDPNGFACVFGAGARLDTPDGKTLWKSGDVNLRAGVPYVLEGIVSTDRVRVRILDDAGGLLVESVDRYVSDTNNRREGGIALLCWGEAEFSAWSFEAP